VLAGSLATLAIAAAPSAAAPSRPQHHTASGDAIRFALPVGQNPNWIFPLVPTSASANWTTIQMWRPLYWLGQNGKAVFNPSVSIAKPPVFSNGGRTVTVTLKPYKWSDGKPVTIRDVQFWVNLLQASVKKDPTSWLGYSPGGFPGNVRSIRYGPKSLTITFKRALNPQWLLFNELSQLYAIPQHAWDKTSATGAIGDYDKTPTGALAVARFLDNESKSLSTWTSNPLWQVVDGPYKLSAFDPTSGDTTFVPNESYSGPHASGWTSYKLLGYTSDAAEVSALLAGQLDVGYVPLASIGLKSRIQKSGYTFDPWKTLGIAWMPLNLTNPATGPIFRQLYIRQAMQHLVDQSLIIGQAFHGNGNPTYGPVPFSVPDPFVAPAERHNPYPFSTAAATSLLTSHGWKVNPGGATTCERPGTGPSECGAGIAQGAPLDFKLSYASGDVALGQEIALIQSDFAKAGIKLQLRQVPITTLYATAPCDPKTKSNCGWDMVNYGAGWTFNAPTFIPTGDALFYTGGGGNLSGYSDPKADKLISATLSATGGQRAMTAYQLYVAKQLPMLWMPWANKHLTFVRSGVAGVIPQDPYLQIYPELWHRTS
jgi:peptide/nickel transport system substrate-binding protein